MEGIWYEHGMDIMLIWNKYGMDRKPETMDGMLTGSLLGE